MTGCVIQQYHGAEDGARHAAKHGYSHWYIDGANYEDAPARWDDDRCAAMRGLMRQLDVRPIYHGNFKAPLASDVPELRAAAVGYVKVEIDVAGKLGAPLIIHGGGIVEPRNVKEAIDVGLAGFVESLQTLGAYAADRGVELWLENLSHYKKFHPFYYMFTNIEHYRYVLSRVPELKMLFDVCHETVGGGDPVAVFEELSDRIAAFSFSDTDGQRDSHWPLGEGTIDFDGLTASIVRRQWRGLVAFETRLADPAENLRFTRELYNKHAGCSIAA